MCSARRLGTLIVVVIILSLSAAAQSIQVPYVKPENDTGVNPFGTYSGTRESINLSNGNLNIEIPLLRLKGRNGQDLMLSIQYDSKIWNLSEFEDPLCNSDNYFWKAERRDPSLGLGWRFNLPYMFGGEELYDFEGAKFIGMSPYIFITPDGAKHSIVPTHFLGTADSLEPSPIRVEKTSAEVLVTTADGTKYYFNYVDASEQNRVDSLPTRIVDRSGNFITISNGIIRDNLNRQVAFSSSGVEYIDSEGNTQIIQFASSSVALSPTFSQPQPYGTPCRSTYAVTVRTTLPSPSTLSRITLPGGYTYTFDYNNWGELRHIHYPTGGYTEYDYRVMVYRQTADSAGDFREVAWKKACTSESNCSRTDYLPTPVPVGTKINNDTMTVTENADAALAMDKIVTKYNFTQANLQLVNNIDSAPALETKKEVFAGDGSTLLRRTTTSYTSTYPKLPSSVTTTLDNNASSTETFQYGTYSAYVCKTTGCYQETKNVADVTQHIQYDFSGELLRRTVSTFLSGYYISPHILHRKTREQVYGASGLLSDTKFNYDEYPPTNDFTNPSHHDGTYGTTILSLGNITSVERWRNIDDAWLKTWYWYDTLGNLIRTRDPLNHETQFEYTDSWEYAHCSVSPDSRAYVTKITDAKGFHNEGKYSSCTGTLRRVIDKNGQATTFLYDALGRLKQTDVPANGAQTRLDYTATSLTTTKKITDSIEQIAVQTLDGLGRQIQSCTSDDIPGQYICSETAYDFRNRKVSQTNPHRSAPSATDGTTRYYYDALNRVTALAPPDAVLAADLSPISNYVLTQYSGSCTTVTDQAGKQRKSCSDALGRLIRVDEPGGTPGARSLNTPYTTLYQYNAMGLLTQVDQKGGDSNSANWRTRTASYNSLGQLLWSNNPETGRIDYRYDNDGNVVTRTQPQQNQPDPNVKSWISFCYDELHRVTKKKYGNDTLCSSPDVTYSYDAGANGIDRRTGMTDASGSTVWTYDAVGNVSTVAKTIGTASKSFTYGYNLDHSVSTITYPSGMVLTYRPTPAGRVDQLFDGSGIRYVDAVTYWPAGAANTYKYGVVTGFTGIDLTDAYDKRLQPTLISAASPSQTLLSLSYAFNQGTAQAPINNGLLMTIQNNLDSNWTKAFTYDELNRVLTAQTPSSANYGVQFTIDPWGNLTNKTALTGKNVVWPLSRLVNGKNQFTDATYDAAGNLLNDWAGHSYVYDAENRISSTGGMIYTYDGDGARVNKSSGMLYFSGTGSAPLLETDLSGVATAEYVFFNGKRVARMDRPSGATHYYLGDHIGSTAKVTNGTGTSIEESNELGAYGEPLSGGDTRYLFTGKERDSGGEDYFGARYYGFRAGRFLTPDWSATPQVVPYAAMESPQSLNLYGYVQNNPVTGIDPDGHLTSAAYDWGYDRPSAGGLGGYFDLGGYCSFCGEVSTAELSVPEVQSTATANSGYDVTAADMDPGTDPSKDPLWPSPAGKAQANANPQYLQVTAATIDGVDLELRGPFDTSSQNNRLEQHETRYSRNLGNAPTTSQNGNKFNDRLTGRFGGSGDGTNSIQTYFVIRNGQRMPILVRDTAGNMFYSLGAWIRSSPYMVRLNGNAIPQSNTFDLTPPKKD